MSMGAQGLQPGVQQNTLHPFSGANVHGTLAKTPPHPTLKKDYCRIFWSSNKFNVNLTPNPVISVGTCANPPL